MKPDRNNSILDFNMTWREPASLFKMEVLKHDMNRT